MNTFARIGNDILATLFPARCLGCGRRGEALCPRCTDALPYLPVASCSRCALPKRDGAACRACSRIPFALAAVRAACAYEGVARKAVHAFKFRSGRYLAPVLGDQLRRVVTRRPLQADILVPVPLTPSRLRDRGYNQAELLAAELADTLGGAIETDLLWREERPPQHTLLATERRVNARGAFHCADPATAAGARILLVDDVLTTGATLGACAEALMSAGAARVGAIVFARDL